MSNLKVVTVLKKARALIERPENWMQGRFQAHVLPDGTKEDPDENHPANCFCLVGAINATIGLGVDKSETLTALRTLAALRRNIPEASPTTSIQVTIFNDTHTHQEVLDLVDLTISQWVEGSLETS